MTQPTVGGDLVTVAQCAAALGVEVYSVHRWIASGQLSATRVSRPDGTRAPYLRVSLEAARALPIPKKLAGMRRLRQGRRAAAAAACSEAPENSKSLLRVYDDGTYASVRALAKRFGVPSQTLFSAAQGGHLVPLDEKRAYELGADCNLYAIADVEAWVNARRAPLERDPALPLAALPDDALVTQAEAAQIVGRPYVTVCNWRYKGWLPAVRGRVRVGDVRRLAAERKPRRR